MFVFDSIDDFIPPPNGVVVFIGKADALHLGHIALINETLKLAEETGASPAILSLIPDSSNPIFDPESFKFILTDRERSAFLSNWPIAYLIYQKMSVGFTSIPADDFVRKILHGKLGARGIVVGWDFRFGSSRAGNINTLSALTSELGFKTRIIEPVMVDGKPIKTTSIREMLQKGQVKDAWRLLGYPFFVSGVVVRGKGLGAKIGFPTANIDVPHEKILPRKGVYVGRGLFNGTCKWGLINVGTRPTLEPDGDTRVEIWLMDFEGELYGKDIKMEFFQFIRDEMQFGSVSELKSQIERDVEILRDYK